MIDFRSLNEAWSSRPIPDFEGSGWRGTSQMVGSTDGLRMMHTVDLRLDLRTSRSFPSFDPSPPPNLQRHVVNELKQALRDHLYGNIREDLAAFLREHGSTLSFEAHIKLHELYEKTL